MSTLTRRGLLGGGLATPLVGTAHARRGRKMTEVALVLALDGSGSVNSERYEMQVEGHCSALYSPRAEQLLARYNIALLGCVYSEKCVKVVPWSLITNELELRAFATKLRGHERPLSQEIGRHTGITSVLRFAKDELTSCPWGVLRKVVDVSGDGPNNYDEHSFEGVRAAFLNEGFVINGMPIVRFPESYPDPERDPTVVFYRENLVGGEGCFYLPAKSFEDIGDTFGKKFFREVS